MDNERLIGVVLVVTSHLSYITMIGAERSVGRLATSVDPLLSPTPADCHLLFADGARRRSPSVSPGAVKLGGCEVRTAVTDRGSGFPRCGRAPFKYSAALCSLTRGRGRLEGAVMIKAAQSTFENSPQRF
ncbi:hypothetical protein SRHO_G00070380 [Serrasalmus rhombeus]